MFGLVSTHSTLHAKELSKAAISGLCTLLSVLDSRGFVCVVEPGSG